MASPPSFLQFYGLQRQVSFTGLRQRASQLAGPPSFLQFYGIATPGLTYSIERWTTITTLKLSGSALETDSVVHDDETLGMNSAACRASKLSAILRDCNAKIHLLHDDETLGMNSAAVIRNALDHLKEVADKLQTSATTCEPRSAAQSSYEVFNP